MKKTVLTVTAICLAAVLLCGAGCIGTAAYLSNKIEKLPATAAAVKAPAVQAVSLGTVGTGSKLAATEIYQLACQQVVGISTEIGSTNVFGQSITNAVTGTGFILTADGYILTNNHVVADAYAGGYKVTVMLHDGSEYEAKIVGVEQDNDVAVLKIDAAGLTPVTLGDSSGMLVGEPIYVVGNPLGELTYTMTSGIVSALNRDIAAEQNATVSMFQLDAAVNSGNSGGPVYNDRGQVVGVVTAKYKSTGVEGLSFAIPINDAAAISAELMEHGYVTGKPSLGIMVQSMTAQYAQSYNSVAGAYVYSVTKGSCADTAGMKQGDVITKLGEVDIASSADLFTAKKAYKAGDTASITVYRAGEYLTLSVTFDEAQPTAPGAEETTTDGLPMNQLPQTQPGQEQDTPQDGQDESRSGSFSDFMEDFFGSFYNYFGGGEEPAESPEPDTGRSWGHFGN